MKLLALRKCMLFVVTVIGIFVLVSCSPKPRISSSQLDTPDHHFVTGVHLIDQGKYADADREFDLAIQLDPKYAKGFAGKGLAKAYLRDFNTAFDLMKTAWDKAKSNDEKLLVHINYIRINTLSASECLQAGIRYGAVCNPQSDWLKISRKEYDAAVKLDPKAAAPHYFMGMAYKTAMDINQSSSMFAKVLELKGDYVQAADEQWRLVQKIQRAMPGTITGKKIAFLEQITRADAAALFMEELKIDNLYKKRTLPTFDTSFKDPEKAKNSQGNQASPKDIADHPLRADIEGIINIGVRGLEIYPDGLFHPNDFVDRATYAMMVEDILIKVTGDNALATKYFGQASLFPDLRSDLPYFNAVMVVTSRGLMETSNSMTGEFSPLNPVPGVDALLVIRKFKEELRFF